MVLSAFLSKILGPCDSLLRTLNVALCYVDYGRFCVFLVGSLVVKLRRGLRSLALIVIVSVIFVRVCIRKLCRISLARLERLKL